MSGNVYAAGHQATKSGMKYEEDAQICVKDPFPYVSRGALKLEKAYEVFDIDFTDNIVCDIGASTGGFTDFALQHGATKIFAIDVGTGQLAQKIREDHRVVVMERTDFRDVAELSEEIDIFVCDVSFISLKKIIPNIKHLILSSQPPSVISTEVEKSRSLDCARDDNREVKVVLLIKPQFEAGVKEVSKGKGVIKDPELRDAIVEDIKKFATDQGFEAIGTTESPITGAKGNVEYLLYLKLL